MIKINVSFKGTNHIIQIDNEDLELISIYKWRITSGYAVATDYNDLGKRIRNVRMHRLIMKATDNQVIDHIDGNPLNNQKANLRLCTQGNNLCNTKKRKNAITSKFKGVYWDKQMRKFRARVCLNGKFTHVGLFTNEQEAANAYDLKAKELFGQFARTNKSLQITIEKI